MPNTINPTVVGEAIGVSDLYVAKITADTDAAFTPGTPEALAPTATIARETTVNTKTRYYSNKAMYADSSEGETKVTAAIPGLTVEGRANLLGKVYNETDGIMYDNGEADAPYFAIGYAIDRPDGIKEFYWFLKGKFSIPKDEGETKTDNVNEKTLTLEFTAVTTTHKFQLVPTATNGGKQGGCKLVSADTSDSAFTGAATWFNAVKTPPAIAAN